MYNLDQEPPDDSDAFEGRIRRMCEFWNRLRFSESAGGTTWDVLEFVEQQVTELLQRRTPDAVLLAERLTAKALYLYLHGPE